MGTNQLLELQAADMAVMYDHDFTKKRATETGEKLVADLFERGEVDPKKVLSNIVRLKAVIDAAEKAFRERIEFSQADSWNGVSFTPKNGATKLNYSECPVYRELERKLKDREALLKTAESSQDTIFDSEGCEVPKVSKTFSKPSITITF